MQRAVTTGAWWGAGLTTCPGPAVGPVPWRQRSRPARAVGQGEGGKEIKPGDSESEHCAGEMSRLLGGGSGKASKPRDEGSPLRGAARAWRPPLCNRSR